MKLIKIITLFIIIVLMADYYFGKIDVNLQCDSINKLELNDNILKEKIFTKESHEKYS